MINRLILAAQWIAVVFRYTPFALVVLMATACSTAPSKSHFTPPSTAPVHEKISTARTAVTNAQTHADRAKEAIKRAQDIAPAETPELHVALQVAATEVDALTVQLLTAMTALNSADQRTGELEQKVSLITDTANQAIDQKNVALANSEKLDAKRRSAVAQRNKLFLIIVVAAVWIFRGPIFSFAGFIARKFVGIPI